MKEGSEVLCRRENIGHLCGCAVPTPLKTTPELPGPALGVLPKTGDEELEDRGKPG